MRARFFLAALLVLSCDARDFWRGKAPEQVEVTNPPTPACKVSSDCVQDMNKPLCVSEKCVACNVFDDATANKGCQERTGVSGSRACIRSTGRCGECSDTVLCAQGDTFACREGACVDTCDAHEQCTSSKVCDVYRKDGAGQCLARSEVLYVDNNKACGGDGTTPEKAECDLEKGLAKLGGRLAIRVMPSTKLYIAPAVLNNRNVAFYGPAGKDDASKAKIQGPISMTGTSQVIVDGFDITGGAGGVLCTGAAGARVEVRRNQIQGVMGAAVSVTSCGVLVDRSQILKTTGTALQLTDVSGYRVTNNIIARNNASSAIRILGSSTGVFDFNTVAKNSSVGAPGGIFCGSDLLIENSIFFQNDFAAGSQVGDLCVLSKSVISMGDMHKHVNDSNVVIAEPDFVGQIVDDYHLQNSSKNKDCCIDKAQTKPDVKFDIDGRRRPVGAGYDIGAHEVPLP